METCGGGWPIIRSKHPSLTSLKCREVEDEDTVATKQGLVILEIFFPFLAFDC